MEKEMSGKDITPPLEIDLKLLFAQKDRIPLERHIAAMVGGRGQKKHLVTTYYDSPDLLLRRSGLSLRIRRAGRQRIQTLKAAGAGDQLASHRGEWEWKTRSDQPDLSVLADTPYGPLVSALNGKLESVWVSDVHRTMYRLQHDGGMVEAAIDEGAVRAGRVHDTVRELELELRNGPVRVLYSLVLALQDVVPLRLGVLTKAERGYHLLTGAPAVSERSGTPPFTRKTTLADGFTSLIRSGLNTLIHNQPAAEAGDPEGIHQMRVAIRQLRTMLQMIAEVHPDRPALGLFQSELRRIGRKLGEARDWDVLCLETLPAVFAAHDDDSLIRMLDDAAQEKRTIAYQQLCQELETAALTTLILSLAVWTEQAAFSGKKEGQEVFLSRVTPELLDHLARKVRRRGRRICKRSPEERHALRKSLKKLRYGANYFADLYPSRAVKIYMKQCKKLQKHLGQMNDATVAATLIRTLGETHLGLVPAAGIFARWNDKRHRQALRRLPAAWRVFRHTAPFWH